MRKLTYFYFPLFIFVIAAEFAPSLLLAQTTSRPCPYSCRTVNTEGRNCKDWREGNTCFVELSGRRPSADAPDPSNDGSDSNRGGRQQICEEEGGTLTVKSRCRENRGEERVSIESLSARTDIAIAGIPSGTTVFGVVGGNFQSPGVADWAVFSSLPGTASMSLVADTVTVASTTELLAACGGTAASCLDASELTATALCTGTTNLPTAPAGRLCIYPEVVINASGIVASPVPAPGSAVGFSLGWNSPAAGNTAVRAIWAYTAP